MAEFLGVAGYAVRGDQDPGFDAAAVEDVDEVPDGLAVYRACPVFALDQQHCGQQRQPVWQPWVADGDVDLFGAEEAGDVPFRETAGYGLEEVHRERLVGLALRIGCR